MVRFVKLVQFCKSGDVCTVRVIPVAKAYSRKVSVRSPLALMPIGQQVPLLDPAFLLRRKPLENFPKVLAQLSVKRLPATFGNEHDMVFAVPFRVT